MAEVKDNNVKEFNSRWLSVGIGEDYKKWTKSSPKNNQAYPHNIFIESPTGTGKTHFIINKLFPYAAQNKRNILYLGNRTALKEQLFMEAKEKYQTNEHSEKQAEAGTTSKQKKSFDVIQHPDGSSTLTLINYQSLLGQINKLTEHFLSTDFYYVIFDECHFFIEDANFNAMIAMLYENIFKFFSNSVCIFLSATIEEVCSLMKSSLQNIRYYGSQIPTLSQKYIFHYTNKYRHSGYKLFFYNNNDELIRQIGGSDKEEKWLIFTSSKIKGRILKEQISLQTRRTVEFLSAEEKETSTWRKITKNSKFNENVLITTKTLDNGINIQDDNVKNVVLPFCYRIEFLQMLGRKRVDEREIVNVYVKQPTQQVVDSLLKKLYKQYKTINEISKIRNGIINSYGKVKEDWLRKEIRFLQKLWNEGESDNRKLFYIDYNGRITENPLAFFKIILLISFYEELLSKNATPGYMYAQKVRKWLNYPEDIIHKYVSSVDYEYTYDLIERYINTPIPQNEQEEFYTKFITLYKYECCRKYADDPQKLKEALSVRKEKARRKATLNECLTFLESPLELKKVKNEWIFVTRETFQNDKTSENESKE